MSKHYKNCVFDTKENYKFIWELKGLSSRGNQEDNQIWFDVTLL